MSKPTGSYPSLTIDTAGTGVVSQAGATLLVETVRKIGLDRALSTALGRWRAPTAIHDPGKIVCDLAITLAIGGDCLADITTLRTEPALFGPVASDPTVSRLIDTLATDVDKALAALDHARAHIRARTWTLAGDHAPDHDISPNNPMIIDLDATLITAHSDKEHAAPTFKRGYGFHPLCSFADHDTPGTGEPLAVLLRPGNAGSNTAADHITVTRNALRQLPFTARGGRVGRKILIRTDAAGGTHEFVDWLQTRKLGYSLGFTLPEDAVERIARIPATAWTPAYDEEGAVREGAWVAEATGVLDLSSWPTGMRVLVRKERPHPGAQLRFTDADGHRLTAFATNTVRGQLADLELRHRRRARAEDRIRTCKATGLTNLPLHGYAHNRIWVAIVMLAVELTAWTQMLALTGHEARRWEPKRLRLRLFSIAGRIARHARRVHLRLAAHAPWSWLLLTGHQRLHDLPLLA
ncbi:IS1380 family transposase [Umezawaea sp. Da 62-37]|uniref:IS1380 family transposase n=1 Tax=Umezawaea sp. Da 62-37 TaxID=3075927 RepID=UPI0028F709A8|nr:IS1380 family transposase [Umezawaea sp. Da 62-37]WNV83700.1 IS1380 family transposase [Umezawaea sp. Da 62-37]WNV84936.1 IS1380 family transposase [Umezawaea sp. Da 62-37]